MSQGHLAPLIFTVAIVVLLGVRIWRASKEQRFSPGGMWVVPAVFAAFTVWLLVSEGYTQPLYLALMVAALGAGFAIGWYQGTHTTVRVDHAAHAMFVKISPIGSLIWIGVLVLRIGVRYFTGGLSPGSLGSAPQMPTAAASGLPGLVSMFLLVLAVGVIVGLRAYLQRIYETERAVL